MAGVWIIIFEGNNTRFGGYIYMRSWVLATYIFSEALFFGVLAVFSVSYDADSTIHMLYNTAFAVLIIVILLLVIINKLFKKDSKIHIEKFCMVLLLITLLIATVYGFYRFDQSEVSSKILRYVFGLTVPAIFLALCIDDGDRKFFEKIKYINIFVTVSFGIPILEGYIKLGSFTDVMGTTHLLIGYTMSSLYAYNLLNLINSKKIFKKIIYIGLIIINIAMIIFSGSRGSFACITVISMVMIWSYRKRISFLKVLATLSLVSAFIYVLISKANDSFALQRMLMVFSSDLGISTSGRDIFYKKAIDTFLNSPIFGNGIGAYANIFGIYVYPHNIILEILNDFGILGLIVFLVFIIKAFKNLAKMLKQDKNEQIIALLFLNSITMLLFSSSYLVNAQFWMSFVLVYTYHNKLNVDIENFKSLNK